METVLLGIACALLGLVVGVAAMRVFRRKSETRIFVQTIAERVRSVGKLVGLEVLSKEIVTQTKGLGWLPPLVLSQARLAMIFYFEKQYYVDLSRVQPEDVTFLGGNRYRLRLPPIEGQLHLREVSPYDIQSGKLLGLLDVFRMDADTQRTLMQRAQDEAERLYSSHARRYEIEARQTIARQVSRLLELFDVEVEIAFSDRLSEAKVDEPVALAS